MGLRISSSNSRLDEDTLVLFEKFNTIVERFNQIKTSNKKFSEIYTKILEGESSNNKIGKRMDEVKE